MIDNDKIILARLLYGYKVTQCLYVAAKLDIADHLLSGAKEISEIASLVGVKPEPLYRVMRCLASVGVFNEKKEKVFSLNTLSEKLVSNAQGTLKDFVKLCGEELYLSASELLYTVQTGIPGFEKLYGMNHWEYLNQNPDKAHIFNNAMGTGSEGIINDIVTKYDFSPYKKIIDVGGGKGHIICGILSAYSNTLGVVYDLAHTHVTTTNYIKKMGLTERCKVVIGDFFESIPSQGDIYLLKVVLHDWNDQLAGKILRNCHKAMTADSKLIIIEKILDTDQYKDLACLGDINMLATLTGKERSLAEYENLLNLSNLGVARTIDTSTPFKIIEAQIV